MTVQFRKLAITGLIAGGLMMSTIPSLAQNGSPESRPKVGTIETEELSKLVLERMSMVEKSGAEGKAPPPAKFVLVDVRSSREMSVSVIPGAISQADFEKNIDKYQGMVVIPYCTVGGRCGEFSRRLAEAGWTVRSYRGSIVEWVKSEQPLVTPKGERTTRFHTNGNRFDLPSKYQQVTN